MSKQKIRTLRLKKEEISLEKQPLENAFVKRVDDLKFYYCLYNLQDDFKGGFYFGLLELHPQYPFAAPKLFMYTPNGRFQANLAICTSFTNYHQQSWTSAWNVRTLIQATISFMYSNQPSYGCRHDGSQIRKVYARQSMKWNMNNQLFVNLFGDLVGEKIKGQKDNKVTNSKKLQQSNRIQMHGSQLSQQLFPKQQQDEIHPRNYEYMHEEQLIQPLFQQQQNQQERKWYRKKWVKVCGAVIFIGVGIGCGFYLKR